MTTTIADALRGAAQIVRQGWCQNLHHDSAGRRCALGAIDAALFNNTGSAPLPEHFQAGMVALRAALGFRRHQSLTEWNDAEGQTAENVAMALELAAIIWERTQIEQSAGEPA